MIEDGLFRRHTVWFAGSICIVIHLGGIQKRLCRDAARIQAGTAQVFLFNQKHAIPMMSRILRTVVARRPSAYYNDIKFLHVSSFHA